MFGLNFLNRSINKQYNVVEVQVGQRWYMPDEFVDRFCEPIITEIVEIKDNIVVHINNYGCRTEESLSLFKALYTPTGAVKTC